MTQDDLDEARYARMRWNTPLSVEHAGLLMDRLDLRPGLRIADLGCGWGELLLQVVARAGAGGDGAAGDAGTSGVDGTAGEDGAAGTRDGAGGTTGIGVDADVAMLGRARRLAQERGLDRHVTFTEGDAAGWPETADRVLCIGAAHAFGDTGRALATLAGTVPPGGRLLYGDGYWQRPPSAAATEMLGDNILTLPQMLAAARSAGWRVIHLSTTDQREWDDFESSYRAGRQEWLIGHGGDPRAAELRDRLDNSERQYVEVYRQVLDFAYLVLGH